MRIWCCRCVCMCIPPYVARQQLNIRPAAATNTYATIEELLDTSFSMRFVFYQRKVRVLFLPDLFVSSSYYVFIPNIHLTFYMSFPSHPPTLGHANATGWTNISLKGHSLCEEMRKPNEGHAVWLSGTETCYRLKTMLVLVSDSSPVEQETTVAYDKCPAGADMYVVRPSFPLGKNISHALSIAWIIAWRQLIFRYVKLVWIAWRHFNFLLNRQNDSSSRCVSCWYTSCLSLISYSLLYFIPI
jgi:hypothetical protein